MYNKKSKAPAILTIITAILLIGYIVMLPILLNSTEMEFGEVIAIIFVGLIVGFLPLYASAIPFFIVALVFGVKMLKQQERKKLISLNVRMLITTCVLLPFLALGLTTTVGMVPQSWGVFPVIYGIATALFYVASLIVQIVTIVKLKKMPDESELAISQEIEPTVTQEK